MCDNSSITRTKVGGTVYKPCKCPDNRVAKGPRHTDIISENSQSDNRVILLGRSRPY